MRKYFVTGFYLLIIGGILLLGGFVMGANRSVVWDHGFKTVQQIDETYPLSEFKNVYIEGRDTNVNLKLGDRYKIHIDGEKSSAPSYKIKDDTLTISGQERKGTVGVGVVGRQNVTITIPMNKTLDNVNVRLADGNVKMNDLTIDNLIKSAKDLDYDSNMYLSNVTVNNSDKVNLYNATLAMKNSKLNNVSLIASAYSNVKSDNSTITKSNFNLDESNLNIKKSNLDTLKSLANHSKINVSGTTLMNHNTFSMFGSGHFVAKELTVDGYDLSTDNSYVRYQDKNYGTNYQTRTDANNLLIVKTAKAPITIK